MPSPIYRLPPFQVDRVMLATAETIDWGLKLLGIPPLWQETKGSGIKVAVLDTGIALEHPDLQPAILRGPRLYPQSFRRLRRPRPRHPRLRNHCRPTQCPRHRRRCPRIENHRPLKFSMMKVSGTAEEIVAGIQWAVEKGADILSMSLGSSGTGRRDSPSPPPRHLQRHLRHHRRRQ